MRADIPLQICIISIVLTLFRSVKCIMIGFNESGFNDISTGYENNIVENNVDYDFQVDKKYGIDPKWRLADKFNKNSHKYHTVKYFQLGDTEKPQTSTEHDELSVIPLKYNDTFVKTTVPYFGTTTINDETTQLETTLAPLEIINKNLNTSKREPEQNTEITTERYMSYENIETSTMNEDITENPDEADLSVTTDAEFKSTTPEILINTVLNNLTAKLNSTDLIQERFSSTTSAELVEQIFIDKDNKTFANIEMSTEQSPDFDHGILNSKTNMTENPSNKTKLTIETNFEDVNETEVPLFSELDYDAEKEVPEDYYDGKDEITTKAPNTDAISVIFGLAGSIAETVAEKVLPRSIFDIYKRLQKQSEALEIERLRSPEENGGIGQFGRGLLKSLSSGLTKPLNQLMAGVRDIGSLDTDRSFVSGVATGVAGVADGVANVANSLSDAFKDKVTAIYPGTLWCGDGNAAKSRELGLFFLTDTCCRQHDACKIYIRAGETKFGLTNTGLFTRSHCSCDTAFKECLKKTNSLVSNQIGLTFFNVLGPQCFRRAHPIIKCIRRTRLTGQKCEQYEFDYAKPKMWQWFDNETF